MRERQTQTDRETNKEMAESKTEGHRTKSERREAERGMQMFRQKNLF